MALCKTAVSPLLMHWRYCSLALNHWLELTILWSFFRINPNGTCNITVFRNCIRCKYMFVCPQKMCLKIKLYCLHILLLYVLFTNPWYFLSDFLRKVRGTFWSPVLFPTWTTYPISETSLAVCSVLTCFLGQSTLTSNFSKKATSCDYIHPYRVIFTQGLRLLSWLASVCVCPSVFVCVNHKLVCAINHDPFKLGSDHKRGKIPWLRSLLFREAIDLDVQGQI